MGMSQLPGARQRAEADNPLLPSRQSSKYRHGHAGPGAHAAKAQVDTWRGQQQGAGAWAAVSLGPRELVKQDGAGGEAAQTHGVPD